MRFVVTRTRPTYDDQPPCEGAVKGTYTVTQQRRLEYKPDRWHDEGANHRENKSMCYRDVKWECWFLEIPDLAALMRFHKKHGDIVLTTMDSKEKLDVIEIYDGYRE